MRWIHVILWGIIMTTRVSSQEISAHRDSSKLLEEVKVMGVVKKKVKTDLKLAVTVDEFLASSQNISFIKRGAYAWEPMLNNMSSERSSVTIDGMHIFGACTDKMDPITSYVETNNLSTITIKSGQEGNLHGATVAGSIDLQRKNTAFGGDKKISGSYQTGFEFNNKQFFNLADLSYSSQKFTAEGSISLRNAKNYYNGNNEEVKHSQFNKFNSSLGFAVKTGDRSAIRIDAIYDKAKDVGFPALPMDLSLSRAIITSASYKQLFEEGIIQFWDSKVYFNTIEHYMDDTTRPENLVHMDMPGWSTTYGLISKIALKKDNYTSEVQLNVYDNLSIAEMRMYPQDRSMRTMFAYSWPWVTTRFAGVSNNNSWNLSERSHVVAGGSLGVHYNYSKYAEFNWIFHPGAPPQKTRILPGLYASYHLQINQFEISAGTGYGHRAPSISEAYGYYIYNSFDRYDYIGNPNLKNEISYETNASIAYKTDRMGVQAKVNYFYIQNYIVGKILNMGSPMNYQSVGVKGYTALDQANIFNAAISGHYDILAHLHWKGNLTYARATDGQGGNLPFIRPLTYQSSLHYMYKRFGIQTSLQGDAVQRDYSPEYGEDKTPAYCIWNMSADYILPIRNLKITLQVGAENLLNAYYSTYADWGNIPRMGRNIFTSAKINF
ncbi:MULTISPECIES: TonB-dependent receptor [Sphingobacterium]|uniref:TonB-dependent receptor n=1 Tax=Sphingobacterium TaxID=28453 RepID=UPI0013DC766E|nr:MULTISPECIES: TonB-dependent receptor [unclassified Sphingobacterium]